jgi:hypothetical protein
MEMIPASVIWFKTKWWDAENVFKTHRSPRRALYRQPMKCRGPSSAPWPYSPLGSATKGLIPIFLKKYQNQEGFRRLRRQGPLPSLLMRFDVVNGNKLAWKYTWPGDGGDQTATKKLSRRKSIRRFRRPEGICRKISTVGSHVAYCDVLMCIFVFLCRSSWNKNPNAGQRYSGGARCQWMVEICVLKELNVGFTAWNSVPKRKNEPVGQVLIADAL